ncbi:MAG: hypothetical protein MZV63_66555 [Marinilabiliales bacterium]|nr:hypothetical protein [Marinilabiliales bacterium]
MVRSRIEDPGGNHGPIDQKMLSARARSAPSRGAPRRRPAGRPRGPGPPARRHRRPHGRPAGQAGRGLGLGRKGRARHGRFQRPGEARPWPTRTASGASSSIRSRPAARPSK